MANPIGNDLPEQGGFTGNMPRPATVPRPETPSVFSQIFKPQPPKSWNIPQVGPIPEKDPIAPHENIPSEQLENLINWKPTTEATDRYEKLVGAYPKRDEYNPGFWRSLGAMVVDYSKGPQRGQAFYDEPFNDAQEDWKEQIGPAYQAANLERYGNVNERMQRYQTASQELRDRKQQADERKQEADARIREMRAEVYKYKNMLPKWKLEKVKGGNYRMFNPDNPLESVDTGIPTGTLSEIDEAILNKDLNIQVEEAKSGLRMGEQQPRLDNQRDIAEMQGGQIMNDAQGNAYWVNPRTRKLERIEGAQGPMMRPPTTASAEEAMNPYQERVHIGNRAKMIRDTMPELGQYLTQDAEGNWSPIPPAPPGWLDKLRGFEDRKAGTPTQEEFEEIKRILYEGTSMDPRKKQKGDINLPSEPTTPQTGIEPKYQKNTVTGEIRVSYDGGKTWQPFKGGQ